MPFEPGFDFVFYAIYRNGVEVQPADLPQDQQDALLDLTNVYGELLEKIQCAQHPRSSNLLKITWRDHVTVMAWCCCELRLLQLQYVTRSHGIPLELTHSSLGEPLPQEELRARFLQWLSSRDDDEASSHGS